MPSWPQDAVPIEILSDDDEDSGIDDGDVVALQSPPAHLRRQSNIGRPITVVESDEDSDHQEEAAEELDEAAEAEAEYRRRLMMEARPVQKHVPRKRSNESSTSASTSSNAPAPPKRPRVDFQPPDNRVGSSRQAPITTTTAPTNNAGRQSAEVYVAQIIEILPDICPNYAMREVLTAAGPANHGVENVVAKCLEEGYPKAADTQKKMEENKFELGQEEGYRGKVFRAIKRRGHIYRARCDEALSQAFPTIPMSHVRLVFAIEASLFGPTYMRLRIEEQAEPKPYKPLTRGRLNGKDKATQLHLAADVFSKGLKETDPDLEGGRAEFELERNWILGHVAEITARADAEEAQRLAEEQEIADGGGLECGCCFGDYVWANMFQCQEGHLFCKECSTKHAETKLGDQEHTILCMDTSGCQALFVETELSRLLSVKSLELYHRLKLAKELEQAAIEGLENCPFCPWAVVIDNPDEKLFRCENGPCRKVSCRACKKAEHLPKSCKEAEDERKAGGRHAVEDAMSAALIRKCPDCAKPYIKDSGCNKIICLKCQTMSCYICQKAVRDYSHFDGAATGPWPLAANVRVPGKLCPLWDHQEAQHDNENIIAARDAAVQAQRDAAARDGVKINEDELRVDAPPPPLPPAQPFAGLAAYNYYFPAPNLAGPQPVIAGPPLPLAWRANNAQIPALPPARVIPPFANPAAPANFAPLIPPPQGRPGGLMPAPLPPVRPADPGAQARRGARRRNAPGLPDHDQMVRDALDVVRQNYLAMLQNELRIPRGEGRDEPDRQGVAALGRVIEDLAAQVEAPNQLAGAQLDIMQARIRAAQAALAARGAPHGRVRR